MEHKSWPWKKKSTEKTMIAADKVNRGNEDELQANLVDKAELQRNLKIANEKLLAALAEINAKDEIAKKQTNIAREAIQGWEKAEAEVLAVKQELEKATQQRVYDEERLHGTDAALKESMMQLRFLREEHQKRIHDAVMMSSREHEKTIIILEEKLAESNKKLSKLTSENTHLSKNLSSKEKMIDELNSIRAQLDYDLSAIMTRLESTQRENGSLSYEIRVLEKELEIRNEERDFNRRTADVAHKQYLESVKKIAKLETEAQRLRMLVRKRLPSPADMAKMKNIVDFTRRRSNPFPVSLNDTSGKQIAFLTEQLSAFEEENKLLKEFLNQKTNESSKSQTGQSRNLVISREFSISASSDMGSDEKVSMAESWAPSSNTVGASDIGLMDDFIEMEKFASSNLVQENHTNWVENILKVISEHAKIMRKNSNDMLDDIKFTLDGKNNENLDAEGIMNGSIQRLIELIEGIRLPEKDDNLNLSSPYNTSEPPRGYTVHIFQWKTSELRGILEIFVLSCKKLLNGKVGMVDFTEELTSALEWVLNHCFSLRDVSSVSDEVKKQFDWDENRSESEVEGGNLNSSKDQGLGWPMANVKNKIFQLDEVRKLKDDVVNLELKNKDLEGRLESERLKCESLIIQLQEKDKKIGNEVDIMVKNLDEKLADQESTSVEDQENKSSSNEELDAINLDEEIVPESVTDNKKQNYDLDQEKTIRSAQEITASSEKLMECQETILNLGKQLKALASPPLSDSCEITSSPLPDKPNTQRVSLLDKQLKVLTSPPLSDTCEITTSPLSEKHDKTQRVSLLDKMISEDATGAARSPKKEEAGWALVSPGHVVMSPKMFVSVNGVKDEEDEEALVNFLSIVPNKIKKKNSGGMLKRLFWRRKKGSD